MCIVNTHSLIPCTYACVNVHVILSHPSTHLEHTHTHTHTHTQIHTHKNTSTYSHRTHQVLGSSLHVKIDEQALAKFADQTAANGAVKVRETAFCYLLLRSLGILRHVTGVCIIFWGFFGGTWSSLFVVCNLL